MKIASRNAGRWISVEGFELADPHLHQIAWLGFGENLSSFVVPNVEAEVMRQRPASQVLSITCKGAPTFKTKAERVENSASEAIVSGLRIVFPLTVVLDLDGERWMLEVALGYLADNLDKPQQTKRSMCFDVQSSAKMR